MSSPQTDYYAILGLNARSGQDEIKKRYRELARRYHPDVNHSPDAAQKIKTINQAYHVLGDADRRATYDANRVFQFPQPRSASDPARPAAPSPPPRSAPANGASAARPAAGGTTNPNAPRSPYTPRPAAPRGPDGDFDFNGFGRVINEAAQRAQAERDAQKSRPPGASRPAVPFDAGANPASRAPANDAGRASPPTARSAAQRKAENAASEAGQLLSEAKLAFVNRQYDQSARLSRQVIQLDRANAVAYELLGDSARKQGDTDAAIQAYSFAIQLNPRNQSVQASLDRLMGSGKKAASGPKLARAADVPFVDRLGRDVAVNGAGGLAAIGTVALLGALYVAPGLALAGDLSLNLMLTLPACGLLGGFLLALYGNVRPQKGELATRGAGRGVLPLGGLLSLFALVWFGASLLAYMVVAVTQNRVSPSVLRAYGLTLVMNVAFALLYHPYSGGAGGVRAGFSVPVAVVSGNFLFPMILLGWQVGDALRLRSFSVS